MHWPLYVSRCTDDCCTYVAARGSPRQAAETECSCDVRADEQVRGDDDKAAAYSVGRL